MARLEAGEAMKKYPSKKGGYKSGFGMKPN